MRLFGVVCLLMLFPLLLLGNTISVHVKGLVCPSCAIGITKHLSKTKKVKKVTLDVQTSYTHIILLKNKQINDINIDFTEAKRLGADYALKQNPRQRLAVRRKRNEKHVVLVAFCRMQWRLCAQVPQPHSGIASTRG